MSQHPTPPRPHIVIVGGGLAGLATASALADRGLQITIIESRPRLGGRASSFNDPASGDLIDNCQHVSMACCTNLADFCRRVGIDSMVRRERQLVFLGPDGRISKIRAGPGPAPFHLAGSFLAARFLGLGDKLRVAFGLACLASGRDFRADEPFAEWLLRHRQSLRAINLFWAPVLVSALNERLEQMDFGHARKVFLDGFLRNRTGFQPEIPLVPLGELYGTRLVGWLCHHDVAVRLTTGVREIELDGDGAVRGLVLRSGEEISADFVVLAVPFDRVGNLIPDSTRHRLPALASLDGMRASPITGVHLWFDRPVCPYDHVVILGRLIQWVFNHTAIQGRAVQGPVAINGAPACDQGQYVQVVISASYDLLPLDKLAIRDAVLAELAEIWPSSAAATLLRSWVVTEHGATFAVRPGVEALRPAQRTPVDGLFLAGDWTDTGWPATMEGAVRSGYLAAQGIMSVLDQPIRFLRPELKPGLLALWLFGKSDLRPPKAFMPEAPAPFQSVGGLAAPEVPTASPASTKDL
jgi:squalene-associated FAD-dependent desaturase